ncbi:MAG: heparinase II/III domain-containing protein [Leadbetterella sp.]
MRICSISIIFLFIFHSGFSQLTNRNILANKYSLEFIKQNLVKKADYKPYPKTSEEWKKILSEEQIKEIIQVADSKLVMSLGDLSGSLMMEYKRTQDREKHFEVLSKRYNALMPLILAECIDNQGKYTEQIFNIVWAICEQSYWGVPATISNTVLPDVENPFVDLFVGETVAMLALTDYFVGEKLDKISPLIRKRMYYESKKRAFDPIKTRPFSHHYLVRTKTTNNWNPWIMSNLILANLLLEKNDTLRAENIKEYLFHMDLYLNSLGEDGGCEEGPTYWYAAGASVFDALDIVKKATNNAVNVYGEPLIKNMASYIYKVYISDKYYVPIADCEPKLLNENDGIMLYRYGTSIQDPTLAKFGLMLAQGQKLKGFLSARHAMRNLDNLISINNFPNYKGDYVSPSFSYMKDIQLVTSQFSKSMFFAAHGGHNAESHNHNDIGDFMIYANGEPVIIDAGRGSYTGRTFSNKRYEDIWFTRADHHNIPIINGISQQYGRAYQATQVEAKPGLFKLSLLDAYPKDAKIISWIRTIKTDSIKSVLELTDTYQLGEAKSLEQILLTVCKVDTSQAGKIIFSTPKGLSYQFVYDKKAWTVSLDYPSMEGPDFGSFAWKWDHQKIVRIHLIHKNPKPKGSYTFTFKQ